MTRISSPCTKICKIDDANGLCLGCGRTLAQIARWGAMSEKERLAIMAGLDRTTERLPHAWPSSSASAL